MAARSLLLGLVAASLCVVLWTPGAAGAQDMNLALSRLSAPAGAGECVGAHLSSTGEMRCRDDGAYRSVMTQFAGSMLPPVLTPAGTRGVRGLYVGFETWLTGIDHEQEYWHRAVEGDGASMDTSRSRFVDTVLAWGRFNVRKGLPFGFELGTNVGYLANTSYWTLGLEIRWALFEGFRTDVGWIPDIAVRGAVQTLIGDGEFNMTVPSIDLILSEPFVVGNSVEITPSIMGQLGFVFVDSELVDLTPDQGAFTSCAPNPLTPTPSSGSPPYCTGDGSDLNANQVFPSLRSTRFRLGAGLQIRYEWFTVLGAFIFDALPPAELDGDLPAELPRQWQVDLGVGLSL